MNYFRGSDVALVSLVDSYNSKQKLQVEVGIENPIPTDFGSRFSILSDTQIKLKI